MSKVEVWFESHTLTPDNEVKRASGWNDVDLSAAGRQQAVALIERARERHIEVVFCSDLQRAIKTAIPTVEALHIPLYVDSRLREANYGELTDAPSGVIEQARPNYIDKPFPGGESYRQVMERMHSFFSELPRNFAGKTVMIVGHRATQYALEIAATGKTLEACMAESSDYWVGAHVPGRNYELT